MKWRKRETRNTLNEHSILLSPLRTDKYDGSDKPRNAPAPPSDEDVYEEVESQRSPESDITDPQASKPNQTSNDNASKELSNFRKKLQMFELAASKSGTNNTTEPRRSNSKTADVYEDANSSGGACAQAEGSGGMYEALGDRDYETPYTLLKPVPAKKSKK